MFYPPQAGSEAGSPRTIFLPSGFLTRGGSGRPLSGRLTEGRDRWRAARVGGGRLAGAGKGEGRRERSQRPPSLTHSPVGLAAPVPAAAPKLKAMRGRGVWVLPGRTGGASGTLPPRRLSAWYRPAAPRPLCPRSGCTTVGGGGERQGVRGGELLEAEGSLLGVGLSLRELKSSGLSLNIVFSFPKCHVLSSRWPEKEGNTTATRR